MLDCDADLFTVSSCGTKGETENYARMQGIRPLNQEQMLLKFKIDLSVAPQKRLVSSTNIYKQQGTSLRERKRIYKG